MERLWFPFIIRSKIYYNYKFNKDDMQLTAFLVLNQFLVDIYAFLFNYTNGSQTLWRCPLRPFIKRLMPGILTLFEASFFHLMFFCLFFFFFFFFVFLWFRFYGPFKNISLIEPIVHQRWAKTGESAEKPLDHPVSITWLSHIWLKRGSIHSGEKPNH